MGNPESVIADDDFLYITDIGPRLNPIDKDGDGKIWRVTKEGKFVDSTFFKAKLNSPKGTAIHNNRLYIADIDRVVVFDTKSGAFVKEINLEKIGVKLVNDLCIKDGKELYATCTILGKVLRIPIDDESGISFLNIPEIKGANGISYNNQCNCLAVVGLGSFDASRGAGEIYIVSLYGAKPDSKKIKGIAGFFDGVEWLDSSHIMVDDWVSLYEQKGTVRILNLKTMEYKKINLSPIGGSADFYLDREKKQVIIPATLQGRIIRIELNRNVLRK